MAAIIDELRHEFNLRDLLRIAGMPRSTYYHARKAEGRRREKDSRLKDMVIEFYEENSKKNEKFGYRRICDLLRATDAYAGINHKRVYRVMRELGLKGYISKNGKKRYSSYRGTIGKIADNIVRRNFSPERPNMVWGTDITEFRLPACNDAKVYLSPTKDFCDGSIISHACSTSPNMDLVMDMLNKALDENMCLAGLVLHSDQGFQYQNRIWCERLESRCITQSMSRKGNCLDNSKMETFFATLKKAIWFGHENEYKSPEELMAAIDDYIRWYNEKRVQHNLGGLTPLQFRRKAFRMSA